MDDEILKALCDFASAQELAAQTLKRQIAVLVGVAEPAPSSSTGHAWDPEKIRWDHRNGANGPWEITQDESADCKALMAELEQHGGKLMRNGWFYWTMMGGFCVGRKLKK